MEHEDDGERGAGAAGGAPLWIVRVYLRRRTAPGAGRLRRLWAPPLDSWLAAAALAAGIPYAAVSLGHAGYTAGGRALAHTGDERAIERLPSCVELVGPRAALRAFVEEHAPALAGALVVWLAGAAVEEVP